MAEEVKKSNLGIGTWMVLIGVAIFFDVLEILFSFGIVIGTLIDMVSFATFALVFKMNNETYSKKTFYGGFIIGFIPILNMLPECTASIVMLYLDAKAKNVLAKVPGGKVAAQAGIQGHIAKNTTIVNGEMRNKSDVGNKNSKPAFSRMEMAPLNKQEKPNKEQKEKNPDLTGRGEVTTISPRSTKQKSYEEVIEDEQKNYEAWTKKKAA